MQNECCLRTLYKQPWDHGDGIVQGCQGRLHKKTVFEFEGSVRMSRVERGDSAEDIAYKALWIGEIGL